MAHFTNVIAPKGEIIPDFLFSTAIRMQGTRFVKELN